MKAPTPPLMMLAVLALVSQPIRADDATAPSDQPSQAIRPGALLVPSGQSDHSSAADAQTPSTDQSASPSARGDSSVLPGSGFPASRYESLWTKSPFAVATSEDAVDTSPDYTFVGFASNVGGISYASIIETKPPQEHFVISTDQPTRGLTLTSITRSHDGSDTYAVIQKDGQTITLKLEQPPAALVGVAANGPGGMVPQTMAPSIPMPGAGPGFGNRPFNPRFRRPLINLPPRPQIPPTPAPAPPGAAPAAGAAPAPPPTPSQ